MIRYVARSCILGPREFRPAMAKPDSDLVSILIPCHDAERWVGDAVECALAQDWPVTEVIAADDGSTDRTGEVLASFGPALEEFSKHWPLKRGTPNPHPPALKRAHKDLFPEEWDPYAVSPEDAPVANPAFDVTPSDLISAIITEQGVVRAPYADAIRQAVDLATQSREALLRKR